MSLMLPGGFVQGEGRFFFVAFPQVKLVAFGDELAVYCAVIYLYVKDAVTMFIVFGTKGQSRVKAEGSFYCPRCNGQRKYKHFIAKRYFTLFFIPVFPIGTLGEYVQCQQCQGEFRVEVLDETAERVLLRRIYGDASAGMPLEMISRKLMNSGLSELQAKAAVNQVAMQSVQKQCDACNLTYLADANLATCTKCGDKLR